MLEGIVEGVNLGPVYMCVWWKRSELYFPEDSV